jgi:hypothetical protein
MLCTRIKIVAVCVLAAVVAAGPEARADEPDKARPPADKAFAFEMREKPWKTVFEWYSDASGLPYIGTSRPTGTFTFVGPKGKAYTLAEVTDILNEGLLNQRFLLVRRDNCFTVLPADEKVDRALIRRVSPGDLAKLGKTELVTIELTLTSAKAADVGPDVKKLLGPFGDAVVLEKANKLILTDLAGNLVRIVLTIKEIEDREPGKKPDPPRR